MSRVPLTLACWNYDRTRPLMDGRVKPDGIDLDLRVMRPREAFARMLKAKEFHASEMSLASYVSLKGQGSCPFVAIRPICVRAAPLATAGRARGAVRVGGGVSVADEPRHGGGCYNS